MAPRKDPIIEQKGPNGERRFKVRYDAAEDYGSGKRRQRVAYFPTRGEAKAFLGNLRVEKANHTFVQVDTVTVKTYLDEWVAAQHQVKPKTRLGYTDTLKPVVEKYGPKPLQKLSKTDVNDLVTEMLTTGGRDGNGRHPNTVKGTLMLLKAALKVAVMEKKIAVNVAAQVKPPKSDAPKRTGQAWTVEEARTFLNQVATDRYAAAWRLSLYGLRRGEVLGLAWDAINLDDATAVVRQNRVVAGREVVISTTKNGKERTIPLAPEVVADLVRLRTLQGQERWHSPNPLNLVVVDELGVPMRPETYGDLFHKHASEAGLRRIRLHDCRHTAASLLAKANVPIIVAAKLLGHDPTIYANVYAHLYPEQAEAAISSMSALLTVVNE